MVGNPDFLTGRGTEHTPEFQELESPEGEMHLRFFVGTEQEFALPAIAIKEVTEPSPDQITPVPNVSPLLLGTLNVRGQVLWEGMGVQWPVHGRMGAQSMGRWVRSWWRWVHGYTVDG